MIMGRFQTHTVLVVDDDRDVRESIRDLIEDAGYEAIAVRHGGEAQEFLLRNPRPAIVLLDLMMPNMNGWQFLSWLQAQDDLEDLPVIVMSAAPEHGLALARTTRKLQGWLRKPFEPKKLIETVADLAA
jgi:CheY-like chemotaxis protein